MLMLVREKRSDYAWRKRLQRRYWFEEGDLVAPERLKERRWADGGDVVRMELPKDVLRMVGKLCVWWWRLWLSKKMAGGKRQSERAKQEEARRQGKEVPRKGR